MAAATLEVPHSAVHAALMPLSSLHATARICEALERTMPEVVRFKAYRKENPKLRVQNDAQHLISVKYVAIKMLLKLKQAGAKFDKSLILEAFDVHDHGEGALGIDTDYGFKTENQDLKEYLAFMKLIEAEDIDTRSHLEQLFLLQTCRANPECFPKQARAIMKGLWHGFPLEAMIFDAIQRWDYLFYPLQGYLVGHGTNALVRVARNQIPHYRRFCKEIPGFQKHFFTAELEADLDALVRDHAGQFTGDY